MFAERLSRLAVGSGFCDAVVLCQGGGGSGVRLPVARAVLAAASPQFEGPLTAAGAELRLAVTAAALRVAIAHCCGVQLDPTTLECSVAEVQAAAEVLALPSLSSWCSAAVALDEAASPPRAPLRGAPRGIPSLMSLDGYRAVTRGVAVSAALIAVLSLWAWAPSLQYRMDNNGFFMDDRMIAKNANVFEELDWHRLFRTDYWGLEMFTGTWTHKSFRPLTVLTFRWNYLLHGFASTGWHVTNVLLHGCSSLLLGALGLVLGLPGAWAALLAALFLAHPVHTESVLYIVGRADLICFALILVATLLYAPCLWRPPPPLLIQVTLLLLASLLLVAAGLSKETGFCFFGLLAGWEILGLLARAPRRASSDGRAGGSQRLAAPALRLTLLLAVGAAVCYWRCWYTAGTEIERMDPHSNPIAVEEDGWVRLLSYAHVHGIYAQLLVWPSFLCYDYSFDAVPVVRQAGDARLLLPITAYLAFAQLLWISLAVLRPRRFGGFGCSIATPAAAREAPIVGLAALVLSFFPMSNILFPVGTVIGERLLYIPSAGLLLCAVGLAFLSACGASVSARRGGSCLVDWHRWAPAALLAAGGVAFAVLCSRRVPDWASPEAITVADGLKQLRSGRVQFNYGNVHLQAKRYEEALAVYERAITIDPADRDSLPLFHAGQILIYQGRHKEAIDYLSRAISGFFSPLTMAEEEIWHDFALALWFNHDAEKSVQNFWNALTVNPAHTKSWNNLGCVQGLGAVMGLFPADQLRNGVESLRKALDLDPMNALYWRNIVALLRLLGDDRAATEAWQHLQVVFPDAAQGEAPSDCAWEFNFR